LFRIDNPDFGRRTFAINRRQRQRRPGRLAFFAQQIHCRRHAQRDVCASIEQLNPGAISTSQRIGSRSDFAYPPLERWLMCRPNFDQRRLTDPDFAAARLGHIDHHFPFTATSQPHNGLPCGYHLTGFRLNTGDYPSSLCQQPAVAGLILGDAQLGLYLLQLALTSIEGALPTIDLGLTDKTLRQEITRTTQVQLKLGDFGFGRVKLCVNGSHVERHISAIEPRQHITGLNDAAHVHVPFDQLAANTERLRDLMACAHFAGQFQPSGSASFAHGQRSHRTHLFGRRSVIATGRHRQCAHPDPSTHLIALPAASHPKASRPLVLGIHPDCDFAGSAACRNAGRS